MTKRLRSRNLIHPGNQIFLHTGRQMFIVRTMSLHARFKEYPGEHRFEVVDVY